MGVFVCDECGCVENTALGHFWGKDIIKFKDESKNGKVLCSECSPLTNQWHDKFPKKQWDGKRPMMNREGQE